MSIEDKKSTLELYLDALNQNLIKAERNMRAIYQELVPPTNMKGDK